MAEAYAERLADDPEFVAKTQELARFIETATPEEFEVRYPAIDADEFRRRYMENG